MISEINLIKLKFIYRNKYKINVRNIFIFNDIYLKKCFNIYFLNKINHSQLSIIKFNFK